jgi:benzoate membrane transport protein
MAGFRDDFSMQALGQGLLVALVDYASSVAVVIQGLAAGAVAGGFPAAGAAFMGFVIFLVTASGFSLAGIGSAFWGLVIGLAVHQVLHIGARTT